MAVHIVETKDIPIEQLDLGQEQNRTLEVRKNIEYLEDSIRVMGVLHPILVYPSRVAGKYSIIAGQRRVLAAKTVGLEEISARIFSGELTEIEALQISAAENAIRENPVRSDMVDTCTKLFRHYGDVHDVALKSGLPVSMVREFVKFEQLAPVLQDLVQGDKKRLRQAVRAQAIAEAKANGGPIDTDVAVNAFNGLGGMAQNKQGEVLKKVHANPDRNHEEVMEEVREGRAGTQVIINLGPTSAQSLSNYAEESDLTTTSDAAIQLVLEGLARDGKPVDDN